MSDADGDSTMHSSPEIGPDDEMFPDEVAGPSTPTNPATFTLNSASELSPPNSQGPPNLGSREENFTAAYAGSPSAINQNGKRPLVTNQTSTPSIGQHLHKESGYSWDKPEDEPGYEWLNKRAQEEFARAWEQIVDKGSMIRNRYGDPLDPKIPPSKR